MSYQLLNKVIQITAKQIGQQKCNMNYNNGKTDTGYQRNDTIKQLDNKSMSKKIKEFRCNWIRLLQNIILQFEKMSN